MAKDPYRPKIKDHLQDFDLNNDDNKVYDTLFKDMKLSDASNIDFDGCRFKNVILDCDDEMYSFIDCEFINCDCSNASLKSSYLHRTTFNQCKGMGTNFIKSKISYTTFKDCKFTLTNFSESIFDHSRFINSEFSQSTFIYCRLSGFITENIDFSDSDFSATSLENCDFSTNELHNVRVSTDLVNGLSINEQQAISFAKLFGLNIK